MQFIDKIETIDELKEFKKQLGKTIERKLGSPLGERKLNEAAADFLGVRDYNTAMAIVSLKKEAKRDIEFFEKVSTNTKPEKEKTQVFPMVVRAWVFLFNQFVVKNILIEEDIQIILDDFIFDFFGNSPRISDNINNQGWAAQINAINNSGHINEFMKEFATSSELDFNFFAYCLAESMFYLQQKRKQDEYEQKDILDLSKMQ